MIAYLARRLLAAVLVILTLIVFTFFASHYIGDPVNLLISDEFSTPEEAAALKEAAGYNRPAWEQFLDFAGGALRGDFGDSIWQNRPASEVVLERMPATLLLGAVTLALIVVIALPLGIIAGRHPGTSLATGIASVTTVLGSMPSFFLALGLIYIFAVELRWLPTSGYGSWQNLLLPMLALAAAPIGRFTQVIEAAVSGEMRRPYVNTARAKGLRERSVMGGHVLRNAGVVVITLLGGEIILLINGAVLVENIFAWPGVGQISLIAVQRRDLPVLMASVFLIGLLVTVTNLLVDTAYAWSDPRIRLT